MGMTVDRREMTRAAVLGTGIMGSAMARNLLAAGLPTTVWDRSAAATTPLAGAGAQVASSAPRRCAVLASSLKDVDLAIGATLSLLTALSRQWRSVIDAGHGREDVSVPRLGLADKS